MTSTSCSTPCRTLKRGIVQLPVEHWKVVIYRLGRQIRFKCFVLSQDLGNVEAAVPDFLGEFDTYVVALDLLRSSPA